MTAERPQYYPNTLEPIKTSREALQQALQELRDATRHGADLVQKNTPPSPDGWGVSGFFSGISGTARIMVLSGLLVRVPCFD